MGDLLAKASAWLADQRAAHLSRLVTYSRSGSSLTLAAAIGTTSFDIESSFGVEHFESRDFLVRAADLVLDGQQGLPQPGDTVTETQDGRTYTYEVVSPGNGQCYSLDGYRRALRIHTKQVRTE